MAIETSDRIHEATGNGLSVASVNRVHHNISLYQHIKISIEGQESDSQEKQLYLTDEIPPNLLFFGVRDSALIIQNLTNY